MNTKRICKPTIEIKPLIVLEQAYFKLLNDPSYEHHRPNVARAFGDAHALAHLDYAILRAQGVPNEVLETLAGRIS